MRHKMVRAHNGVCCWKQVPGSSPQVPYLFRSLAMGIPAHPEVWASLEDVWSVHLSLIFWLPFLDKRMQHNPISSKDNFDEWACVLLRPHLFVTLPTTQSWPKPSWEEGGPSAKEIENVCWLEESYATCLNWMFAAELRRRDNTLTGNLILVHRELHVPHSGGKEKLPFLTRM